jgi:hypothetical protein
MISVDLAAALKDAGLVWKPASGDRFALTTGAFDGEVFTLSDMVVEAQESRTGTVLGFNGTTEWALDATEATDALWLPREDQLRVLLGSSFRTLERLDVGYRVTAVLPGARSDATDPALDPVAASTDPAGDQSTTGGAEQVPEASAYWGEQPSEAYGRALLALIRRATG